MPGPGRAARHDCSHCGQVLETLSPRASVPPMQHTLALAMMRMMPRPPEALR
ncbi:hypothetical protein STANM309S_02874 [Streptomyces tanashiensis]